MPKKTPALSAIEPRDEELIGMIKKYMFLKYDDEAMINAILNQSGNLITRDTLKKWKAIAKRDKIEAKAEIDRYLENMLNLGMFEDVKTQYEISKDMLIQNSKTYNKMVREGDVNKQIALTSVIIRQMEDMRKVVTSMGYLSKTREILEKGFKNGSPMMEVGTSIEIETRPGSSFDEAVDQSIGEIELKDNEVF